MKSWEETVSLMLVLAFLIVSIGAQKRKSRPEPSSNVTALAAKIRRFAPTVLTANTARMPAKDRQALQKIIAAAKLLDPLFLRQVWSGNEALKQKLEADKSVLGRMRLHYFLINDGPWSRREENEPFIDGVLPQPPQANYYPDDLTKEELKSC